jgi:hypothetical protein
MGFRISIAATSVDWLNLFSQTKDAVPLRFYEMEHHSTPDVIPYELPDLPDLGTSKSGSPLLDAAYLVVPKYQTVVTREIHLNSGGAVYAVDQWLNGNSFVLRPGGKFDSKSFVIGELTSTENEGEAVAFAKRLMGRTRRTFLHIDDFWMGPNCERSYSAKLRFAYDCRYPERGV